MYISEECLRRKKREKRTGGGDEEFDRVEEKILGEKKRKRGGEREREREKKRNGETVDERKNSISRCVSRSSQKASSFERLELSVYRFVGNLEGKERNVRVWG